MSVISIDSIIHSFLNPKTPHEKLHGGEIQIVRNRNSCTSVMYVYICSTPVCAIKLDEKSKSFDIDFGNGFCGYSITTRDDLIYEISLNCDECDTIEELIDNYCRVNHFPKLNKNKNNP